MAVLNTKLKRSIGITFTFKQYLSEFLHDLATSPTLTTAINDAPTMASLVKLANDFDLIGPAMGFAAKQTAYEIPSNNRGSNFDQGSQIQLKSNGSIPEVVALATITDTQYISSSSSYAYAFNDDTLFNNYTLTDIEKNIRFYL